MNGDVDALTEMLIAELGDQLAETNGAPENLGQVKCSPMTNTLAYLKSLLLQNRGIQIVVQVEAPIGDSESHYHFQLAFQGFVEQDAVHSKRSKQSFHSKGRKEGSPRGRG